MSRPKDLKRLLQEERDKHSMELFDKPERELGYEEGIKLGRYIHDRAHPKWLPVVLENGEKTRYVVSNTGLVKNTITGKLLKPFYDHKGYAKLKLYYRPSIKSAALTCINVSVHRLVANAFIPNPENKPQVNHINGKKAINWVGNLEWNTAQENITHAIEHGLQNHPIGEDANHNRYTEDQIRNVCKLLEESKYCNTEISKMTDVDDWSISKIKCRQNWLHISKDYKIPIPVQNAVGSDAAVSKYTDEMVHQVCTLLSDPKNNMTMISKQTHVGYDMVYRIKKGLNWIHISSKYPALGISAKPDSANAVKLE